MITEDFVSFEIAKLLRENGFNGLCTAYYDCFTTDNFHCGYEPTDFNSIDTKIRNIVAAPTLQMTMKWLRNIYNLFIDIDWDSENFYFVIITDMIKGDYVKADISGNEYKSYEQAAEVAIKYCLENLI